MLACVLFCAASTRMKDARESTYSKVSVIEMAVRGPSLLPHSLLCIPRFFKSSYSRLICGEHAREDFV